jgi:hypothetical protein
MRLTQTHANFWQHPHRPTWSQRLVRADHYDARRAIHLCVNEHDGPPAKPKHSGASAMALMVSVLRRRQSAVEYLRTELAPTTSWCAHNVPARRHEALRIIRRYERAARRG